MPERGRITPEQIEDLKLANSVIPLSWAIRVTSDPLALRTAVDRELRAVDGLISASRVRTMEQTISDSLSRQNFNMLLLTIFASIALLLAAIGIYGLMSYSVEQRVQEIGIRVALGAEPGALRWLFVRYGLALGGAGAVIGLATAAGLTRLMTSVLFGISPVDPLT